MSKLGGEVISTYGVGYCVEAVAVLESGTLTTETSWNAWNNAASTLRLDEFRNDRSTPYCDTNSFGRVVLRVKSTRDRSLAMAETTAHEPHGAKQMGSTAFVSHRQRAGIEE